MPASQHHIDSATPMGANLVPGGATFRVWAPFVDEVESTGLGALRPLQGLHAERAVTESLDGKWAQDEWDVNVRVFNSEIHHPLEARPVPGNGLQLVIPKPPVST